MVQRIAKNSPLVYGYWKKDLKPMLGRSVKKIDEAIRQLRICARSPFSGFLSKHSVIRKIANKMGHYEGLVGASISFGELYFLAKDHKRKILRWRKNAGLSN